MFLSIASWQPEIGRTRQPKAQGARLVAASVAFVGRRRNYGWPRGPDTQSEETAMREGRMRAPQVRKVWAESAQKGTEVLGRLTRAC